MRAAVLSLALGFGLGPAFAPSFVPGRVSAYRLVVTQTEYAGSGSKVTASSVTETPIKLTPLSRDTVQVVSGPLFTRGRSVGRPRVSSGRTDGGRPPSWLFVPIPASGVRPGQTWPGPLSAPAPVPAGLRAQYRYRGTTQGFAQIDVTVDQGGASRLHGSGTLFLRPDGVPDHGDVRFEIAYVRPDHGHLSVNSHMTVDCAVKPR